MVSSANVAVMYTRRFAVSNAGIRSIGTKRGEISKRSPPNMQVHCGRQSFSKGQHHSNSLLFLCECNNSVTASKRSFQAQYGKAITIDASPSLISSKPVG